MPRNLRQQSSAPAADSPARFANDKKLAAYLDISLMTLHRIRQDPTQGFPLATRVMNTKRTSLNEVDEWMRSRRQRAGGEAA